jgi:hypothetical protein
MAIQSIAKPDSLEQVPFFKRLTPDALARARDRIQQLRDRYVNTQPDDFLNGLCDRALSYSRYSDIQRVRIWDRNLKYYKGNHLGHWDENSPWWVIDDPSTREGIYRINLYNFYIRSVEALWSKSNSAIEFKPRSDNPDMMGASRVCNTVWSSWADKHWRATERHIEAKHAQITGNYLRRIFYSAQSDALAWRPKVEPVQVTGEDEGYLCNECGMGGPLSPDSPHSMNAAAMNTGALMMPRNPDGACPSCGSMNVDEFGLPPMSIDVVTGQEQYDPGDVMCEVVDPMEGTLHLHSQTFERSPWFVRQRLFASEILEAHFPWAEVSRQTATDLRLIYQRIAQLDPGSNYSFLSDGTLQSMGQLEEFWFEPAMYAHYITPPTISGDINLDPNTAFIEMFPKGCYLQRIGGKIVDGPWAGEKDHEWVHGRFDVVMQGIWGRGQDDALSSNERYEELGSLGFEIAMHQASQPLAINPMRYNEEEVDGHPRSIMLLKNSDADARPSEFVWQGQAQVNGLPGIDGLMSREERNQQHMFSAFASLMGDSEGRSEPATRTAILRDQATQMHASPLELKEECDAATALRVVRLYQQHWTGRRFYYLKGEYDDAEGKYFERADLQGDFEAVAKRGSAMPKGEGERRAAVIEASNFGSLPAGIFNPQFQAMPKLQRFVLDELGITFDVSEVAPDYRKQSMEIRRLQELLPTVLESFQEVGVPALLPPDGVTSQEPTPNELLAQFLARKIPVEIASPPGMPQVGISIDNDDIHLSRCNEWLLADEGMEAHPVLRRAIMIHMQDHVEASMKTAQYKQMVAIGSNAPAMAAAQSMGGPDSGKKTADRSQANRPTGGELQQRTRDRAERMRS